MMKFSIALTALMLVAFPSLAQQVVGTAVVGGRSVTLFSDNTWQYAGDDTQANCRRIEDSVHFCGDTSRWQFVPTMDTEIAAQFRHDDAHYGEYIYEGIGRANGMTLDAMGQLAIHNAATFANISPKDVPVIEDTSGFVAGHSAKTIVYQVQYQGMPVIFANTMVVMENSTVQIATFAIAADYSQKHKDLHTEFVAATQLR